MGYDFALDDETFVVHPVNDRGRAALSIEGRTLRAALKPGFAPGEYLLEIDGRRESIFVASHGDTHFVHWRGRAHRVDAINALDRARRAAEPSGGADLLRAPMPGTVVGVAVVAGQEVEAGALLMTIESMKLQTAITAPQGAVVAEVCLSTGATFDQGAALIRLERPGFDSDDATAETNGEPDK